MVANSYNPLQLLAKRRKEPPKMRKKEQKQLPLMLNGIAHPHAKELEVIDQILRENSIINELVLQDLQPLRYFVWVAG